eukprot:SAG22_NODE_350_length_11853_cov_3.693211_6_plen_170_part_00
MAQEKNKRPLFPGPGNGIVLSPDHPAAPHRLLFPVWLGPDGQTTSASLYYSDDGGRSFTQTSTTWPKDGNDESTVAELQDGALLYVTRSNHAECIGLGGGRVPAGNGSSGSTGRCLELARSTDGGVSFAAVGQETVNLGLRGTPDDISVLAQVGDASTSGSTPAHVPAL